MPDEALEDIDREDELEVFPENWEPMRVFEAMQTQWRVGMNGATGLDYTALPAVMRLCGIRKRQRGDVFEAVRVMEGEMLRVWAERRDR